MKLKAIIKFFIPYGIVELVRKLKFNKNKKDKETKMSVSLSDNQKYPDFCLQAANNQNIFQYFRNNPIYQEILEHTSFYYGLDYLAEIKKNNSVFLQETTLSIIKENDKYGGGMLFNYDGIGVISPSTLRYTKVLAEIQSLFGNIQNKKIAEIGVGYGGQGRLMAQFLNPISYTFIDLESVLQLVKKYIGNFTLPNIFKYKVMNDLQKDNYDFFISNYAFTELPRQIQEEYMQKVILKSTSGYITYNNICPKEFNSYTVHELLAILPNKPRIIAEKPLTYKDNCIIIWGENNMF